jgi:hypothetical protein
MNSRRCHVRMKKEFGTVEMKPAEAEKRILHALSGRDKGGLQDSWERTFRVYREDTIRCQVGIIENFPGLNREDSIQCHRSGRRGTSGQLEKNCLIVNRGDSICTLSG